MEGVGQKSPFRELPKPSGVRGLINFCKNHVRYTALIIGFSENLSLFVAKPIICTRIVYNPNVYFFTHLHVDQIKI